MSNQERNEQIGKNTERQGNEQNRPNEQQQNELAYQLRHLKNHVKYPANKQQLMAACNNLPDCPAADRDWFSRTLPEGNYRSVDEVLSALLKTV